MTNFNSGSKEEIQLVMSEDGSHTLYVPWINEHYHSTHGAIQESKHIFIEAGLRKALENHQKIHLLEVGFGTGLNALLTYLYSIQNCIKVEYTGIEAYPLPQNIFSQLNYHQLLKEKQAETCFKEICSAEWGQPVVLSENFTFTKLHNTIQDVQLQTNEFNLVYFDAFSPEAQSEMWTEEIFKKLFLGMVKGGILVTYCCKGIVKRALKSAGFRIEKLPGPPGKREILRAVK